jgi:hypothetical protein
VTPMSTAAELIRTLLIPAAVKRELERLISTKLAVFMKSTLCLSPIAVLEINVSPVEAPTAPATSLVNTKLLPAEDRIALDCTVIVVVPVVKPHKKFAFAVALVPVTVKYVEESETVINIDPLIGIT